MGQWQVGGTDSARAWSERRSCSRWACSASPRRAPPACAARRSAGTCARRSRRASSSPIPGFPGEKIDRRLLPDIRWMKRTLRHLHHGRLLPRPGARGGRRAPHRPRDRHRPERVQRAGPGTRSASSRISQSRSRTSRSCPGAGSAGTAMPGTGGATTCTSRGLTPRAQPGHPARVVYTRICPKSGGDGKPSGGGHDGGTAVRVRRHGRQWRRRLDGGTGAGAAVVVRRRQRSPAARSPRRSASSHRSSPRISRGGKDRTVRPVLESGPRALASRLARARLVRGTCSLPLKAASFRT